MTDQEIMKLVTDIGQNVLDQLGVTGSIETTRTPLGFQVAITTPDSAILIGVYGATLAALDHLIRVLLFRHIPIDSPLPEIHVDIQGYRQRRIDEIILLANQTAMRVVETNQPEVLQPMSGYERRIVHVTLADRTDVQTESIGDGPARRIVVRPKT